MTIEFIVSNNHNNDLNFPLTILYGYLGCSRSQLINQYSKIWTDRGFNVLIYFPSSIFSNYRNGVKQINQWILKYFIDNPYSSRILIFHSISSGANFLSYHLKYLSKSSKNSCSNNNNNNDDHIYYYYGSGNDCGSFLLPMIKACIFDNITNFSNSFLNFKNNLITSGNIFKYIHSFFLPLFIPLWTINEKKDFKFLISKNNKFHYLVIYNNNDLNSSKYFIKTLKQKGNQFNEKNSNSNIILIEKIINNDNNNNNNNNSNNNNINNNNLIYTESINQLIDLIIYNNKIRNNSSNNINNYNYNNNNNYNSSNIRHQNSKNTLYW